MGANGRGREPCATLSSHRPPKQAIEATGMMLYIAGLPLHAGVHRTNMFADIVKRRKAPRRKLGMFRNLMQYGVRAHALHTLMGDGRPQG